MQAHPTLGKTNKEGTGANKGAGDGERAGRRTAKQANASRAARGSVGGRA